MSKRKDDLSLTHQADTGDYSATKAPENRPHVESKVGAAPAQRPGGRSGTPTDVGMSALDRDTVPKLAAEERASEEIEQPEARLADEADGDDPGSTSRAHPRRR